MRYNQCKQNLRKKGEALTREHLLNMSLDDIMSHEKKSKGKGRGKGKKAARRIDVSNEEARNFRQMAAANEARLQDRAMKVKESELAMSLLNGLPDGEGKAKLQEKLIANVAAMLGVPNEAPAAPAAPSANEPLNLISDEEDEKDD